MRYARGKSLSSKSRCTRRTEPSLTVGLVPRMIRAVEAATRNLAISKLGAPLSRASARGVMSVSLLPALAGNVYHLSLMIWFCRNERVWPGFIS